MEQKNNKDNSVIFEIESLLNKMSNQVNFLIRKEMTMNQLDIDLLMENTRKLYDTICSVELGVRSEEFGVEGNTDSDFDTDTDSDIDTDTDLDSDSDSDFELIELSTDELIDSYTDSEEDEEELGVRSEELGVEGNTDSDTDFDSDTDTDLELIDSSTDELIDSDTVSVIEPEEKPEPEEDSGIRTYRIVRENAPTLGDLLEKTEDNSLAARLQRKPVSDLISAIGINDKFLFLNELFGGSMEKYNKSIRSLNSFSTLLGAKTYMSELQIEFQWDCNSDAYKKLADLVERKFISIHNS